MTVNMKVFQKTILRYYADQGRELPWRLTTKVYPIIISELMLQQTQVDRVLPKYLAFLKRFPDPQSLASAPLSSALILWQGLGYNRRAKYAQAIAQQLIINPTPTYEELQLFPGIGSYTAAAVCSFAYNQEIAAIDTNIHRIFDRFFNTVNDSFVQQVIPKNKSLDWHNALMDFGSDMCTKKNPRCTACPLQKKCHAFMHNTFTQEATKSQKKFIGSVRWHRGQILKHLTQNQHSAKKLFSSLNKKYSDQEKFTRALSQLHHESFIEKKGSTLRIKN